MASSPEGLEGEILCNFLSEIEDAESINAEVASVIEEQATNYDLGGRKEIAEGVLEAVKADED